MLDQQLVADLKKAFSAGILRVRAVTPEGYVVHACLSDVLQHHTEQKPAFCVSLAGGLSVTTTGDHSLFTQELGRQVPVRTDSLVPGSFVSVVLRGEMRQVQVLELLPVAALPLSYDLSVPELENFVLSNGVVAHNSYSIGGVSLDLDKSSKYEAAAQSAHDQFDKQLEKSKQTVNVTRGLQQPRYGTGIRSSFGPYAGRGVLSPRKFVGL